MLFQRMRGWARARRFRAGDDFDGPTVIASESTQGAARTERRRPSAPLVSVVVRTRDRPEDLKVALDSLAAQSRREFEVVIVNDGGADIDRMLQSYREGLNITYVRNEVAHGRPIAVNDGVASARGTYLTFLDDDDVVYPSHLACLITAMDAASKRKFVYSHYSRTVMNGRGRNTSRVARAPVPVWPFERTDLLVTNRPAIHTWLLTRALFESYGGFDAALDILHDWDFLLRVTADHPLVGVPHETCEHRFYLDLENSVTSGRRKILDEARTIYDRYPAPSLAVKLARRVQLAELAHQVALAEELDRCVNSGGIAREDAGRTFLSAVLGFDISASTPNGIVADARRMTRSTRRK
jgi:glycosyltransferase involved in cell wall biosynthesis